MEGAALHYEHKEMEEMTYTRETGHQITGATPDQLRQELQVGEIRSQFLLQAQDLPLDGHCVHLPADQEAEKYYENSLRYLLSRRN